MLTHDQLTRIKKKASNTWIYNDVITLLMEIERLTRHNKQMQTALAQFSDKENWIDLDTMCWQWALSIDPQQLAEQALIHE